MKAKKFISCLLVAMLSVTMVAVGTVSPVNAASNKPARTSGVTLKSTTAGQMKVTWKKASRANGYQVRIGTNTKITTNKKVKNVSGTNATFKSLKQGKKYYAKIRGFKKSGNKKVYGAWSSLKSITVKAAASPTSPTKVTNDPTKSTTQKQTTTATQPTTSPKKPTTGTTSPTSPTKPTTSGGTTPTNPTQPTTGGGSTTPTNPTLPTGSVGGNKTGKLCDEIGHVGFISDVESSRFVTCTTEGYYVWFYKNVDHDINNTSLIAYNSPFSDRQLQIDYAAKSLTSKSRGSRYAMLDPKYWGCVSDMSQFFMDSTELVGSLPAREVKIPVQGGKQYTTYKCLFCGIENTYETTGCAHKWTDSEFYNGSCMGKALVAAGHMGTDSINSQRFCMKCGVYE